MAKVIEVGTTIFNAVETQTCVLVNFEYTNGGLQIRPGLKSVHTNIVTFLKHNRVKFYTVNPNSVQQARYVLSGLSPSTDSNKVMDELREKSIVLSNARQMKRNVIIDGVCATTLLPLWVITILKTKENISNSIRYLESLISILKFKIIDSQANTCNASAAKVLLCKVRGGASIPHLHKRCCVACLMCELTWGTLRQLPGVPRGKEIPREEGTCQSSSASN